MKSSSSITFVMDGNFSRVGREIYSPHMGHEKFAGRFAPHFDAVRIVARAFPKTRPIGSLVTGPTTSFVDLGAIRGARHWLLGLPRATARLIRALRGAQTLMIRFPGNVATLALLLCWVTRKPFSAEIVADPEDYFSKEASNHPLRRVAKWLHCRATAFAARRAQSVRYVTEAYLQEKYPPRAHTASFGFSDAFLPDGLFVARSPAARARPGSLRLINVSMMHNRSKGHVALLEAVARLRRKNVAVVLTLVGDGALRAELEAMAHTLGIANAVVFRGQVSSEAACAMVAEHDLFVLPSLQEGMPRAMLEAMAVGTPVLGTRVGGIPEVLPASDLIRAGSVDAIEAAIDAIARDPAQLVDMRARQQAKIVGFSCSALQERYDAYCRYLIERCAA
ncbi:glycosyltransferase [Burkholderia cenocepacia]|uniref:glycosyltransferase n=1 Tax=Burkholderia cenocepacia TaxID=95486 RepID=UPI000A97C572|nr:glycosyltransferase [Burkholderia cenocepacia]CAB5153638.1 putative glycosyltransferase [Burkholderia cenocepacia]CAB5156592.1 putative glycosyltransferase [Burkholderia cenocepacia]CAB5164806.1 putative glycosyltransferase [Burkholderia cenocepacia]CAB5165240.1 putative glycosyltransferase [Burkholderia cenocepacia]CAB5165480.1 putative glycosyltransferase [Burkholderia cenocepacia]